MKEDDEVEDEDEDEDRPKKGAGAADEEEEEEESESQQVENLDVLMSKMLAIRGMSLPTLLPTYLHPHLYYMYIPPPPLLLNPFLKQPPLPKKPLLIISFTDQSADMPEAERRRFAARAVKGIMKDF